MEASLGLFESVGAGSVSDGRAPVAHASGSDGLARLQLQGRVDRDAMQPAADALIANGTGLPHEREERRLEDILGVGFITRIRKPATQTASAWRRTRSSNAAESRVATNRRSSSRSGT